MSDFRINGDMFGMYVRIPTDFSGALHIYKVVGLIESNSSVSYTHLDVYKRQVEGDAE